LVCPDYDLPDPFSDGLLEAVVASGLGEAWFETGNFAHAEPLLRRSLQLIQNDPGASSQQVVKGLSLLARLYIAKDKLALAENTIADAIGKEEKHSAPLMLK
jgi:hypothetical protein